MKYKIILLSLIFIISFIFPICFLHNQNSSSKAEINSEENQDIIRVGISTNDFSQLEYNQANITADGYFQLIDKSNDKIITESPGRDVFTFQIADSKLSVKASDNMVAENITGPIRIKSLDGSPIEVVGLTRKGKPACFRGEIEIVKAPTKKDKLSVVNILPLNDYLKGVVPNESPVSFGLEALKAQAIAAKNYAIKPRVKTYKQFDVCDSVQCQVYFGYNTEHPLSNQAVDETNGLVALYNGELILALYSSTAGGYTENYENAFSEPGTDIFPAKPKPYLKGKPDIEGTPELYSEEAARSFYSSIPEGFDINSSYYRWTVNWDKKELEDILNKNLSKFPRSYLIYPRFEAGSEIKNLKRIDVVNRGVSGKAMTVQITATNGTWFVSKELIIRRIFEKSGKMLPSANVVFNNICDQDGNLIKIEAFGGGLGHGVGMSQYGAGFMSKNGYTFDQILQHYYDGIAIGTVPVTLTSDSDSAPIRQEFFSPHKKSDLVIENKEGIKNLKIAVNSNYINIPEEELAKEKLRINIDEYVKCGMNEIIYYPPNDKRGKTVKAWIEVFKSKNDW